MLRIEVSVLPKRKLALASLCVDIDETTTCRELVDELVDDGWGSKGACHLVERWNKCERLISDGERVLLAAESLRVCLRCKEGRRRKGRGRGAHYLRSRRTQKRLCHLRHCLKTTSLSLSTQASAVCLKKLAQGAPLAGISRKHLLEPFKEKLAELQQSNLMLSTEISELNIQAGELSGELHTLRVEGCGLRDGVRCMEEDVKGRKWEKEREMRSRVADLQTEAIKLRRELETRNRLNCAQSSKLQTLKESLAEKKRATGLCKEEVIRVKAEIKVSHDSHMTPPVSNSAGYLSSTPHTPTSARKKKAVFEARTRQQLEAEAEEFKRQKKGERNGAEEGGRNSSAKRLDFSSSAIEPPLQSDLVNEVEKSLTVLPANSQGYVVSGEATSYKDKIEQVLGGKEQKVWGFGDSFFSEVMSSAEPSVGRAHIKEKQQSTKRVHFSPEALVLPAALDGELDTVQHCVQQLGRCDQRSYKGATCLHNAVCSSHLPTLQYLLEKDCDVNTQDEDGWTPLHCAVAYSNSAAITTLLSHGACLWLVTVEGDTALALGQKELAAQAEVGNTATQTAAQHSLHILEKAHRDMGVANGGVVYALFSRNAGDTEELSFYEGEQLFVLSRGRRGRGEVDGEGWWEVENGREEKGLVPCTYLGSTPRYQDNMM